MAQTTQPVSADYPISPVPFTAVHLTDPFFAPRIETNRSITIPFAFQKCEETGRVALFERAAAALRGEKVDTTPPGFPFDDTDIYKVLEGAAYALSVKPDPKLDAYLDTLIAKIAAAQEPDGYLYTTRTISPEKPHDWASKERWVLEKDLSHELYNLGHLYEAAVAHYQATGKRTLLDVALKSADLLDHTFGPGKQSTWPGHQIVEMGLVKLYRVSGEQRYLKLAQFFLDERGPGSKQSGPYAQSHEKIVDQSTPVGHAVRAAYMYAGIADVAALTGNKAYLAAIDRIWNSTLSAHLYLTGGIGSTNHGEAFGPDFDLPNRTAYCETCASIANVYWNHRLFLLHADAKYIDVVERTLYNGVPAGVSLDGKRFFYPNPLESQGEHARSAWFGCACCPGNITRFLASIPGYTYASKGDDVYVNLYANSEASLKLASGASLKLQQVTQYPWDGKIRITVSPDAANPLSLHLRVPGWAVGKPVPSDLYTPLSSEPSPTIQYTVNGQPVSPTISHGYAVISRTFAPGDVIEFTLPMPVRRVVADSRVKANTNRVALERGPIVYAAEWADTPSGYTRHLSLPDNAPLTTEHQPELLRGVTVIETTAQATTVSQSGTKATSPTPLTLIPYATWANRGQGDMNVWLPRTPDTATPLPPPTLAQRCTLTTSTGVEASALRPFNFYPVMGKTVTVDITLPEPTQLTSFTVSFFDDGGSAANRPPRSWRLLAKQPDGTYAPLSDQPHSLPPRDKPSTRCTVTFPETRIEQLRVEMTLQPDFSSGIRSFSLK